MAVFFLIKNKQNLESKQDPKDIIQNQEHGTIGTHKIEGTVEHRQNAEHWRNNGAAGKQNTDATAGTNGTTE